VSVACRQKAEQNLFWYGKGRDSHKFLIVSKLVTMFNDVCVPRESTESTARKECRIIHIYLRWAAPEGRNRSEKNNNFSCRWYSTEIWWTQNLQMVAKLWNKILWIWELICAIAKIWVVTYTCLRLSYGGTRCTGWWKWQSPLAGRLRLLSRKSACCRCPASSTTTFDLQAYQQYANYSPKKVVKQIGNE
jgi:hypothetical protein